MLSEQTASPAAMPRRISLRQTFVAFKHRNYRLWFIGRLASLLGSWMQITAQGYLVYDLTKSPAYLGYVTFAFGLPVWLFTLYGGVVADRLPRRRLLVITQVALMVPSFVLAALVLSGLLQPWHVLALAFWSGVATAFDTPARLSFVREVVGEGDMTNAVALNAILNNLATATGPGVAGVIYALLGVAWCFVLNGLSFIAVIVALLLMRLDLPPPPSRAKTAHGELREGLRFVRSDPLVRSLIGMVAAHSMFGIALITLFPAWAVQVLGGDATTNGLLLSARGLGALLSAVLLAVLSGYPLKGRLFTAGTLALPPLLLAFALADWLPLALVALVGVGVASLLIMNVANALVQTLVPDELRGRVMAIYSVALAGLAPLGAVWAGLLAEHTSPVTAVITNVALLAAVALALLVRAPRLRALS